MNKLLLLFTLLFFSYGFSQTVLSEDFDASLNTPPGWTITDETTPPTGEVWTIETGGEAGGFTAGNTLVYDNGGSGNYATFDSDGYGDTGTAENSTLVTPVFDASSLTSVTLEFNTVYNGNFGGEGSIEVYDGSSWVTIQTYASETGGTPNTTVSGLQSFDIPELAGVANAQIRFRWTGNWSISWSIDNVEVFQCTDAAPGSDVSAVSPADGANNVEIIFGDSNSVGQIEWSNPTSGGPVDSYDISLGETSSGDDIGTVESFESGNILLFDFQPNTTYYWKITSNNCAGNTDSPVFSFTTEDCTQASAPSSASVPSPADGAVDTTIDGTDNNSVEFTFNSPSNANTVLLFGTNNPPTQTFNDFTSGNSISGLQPDTQYFWAIDTYNCAGSTSGTVWTFTTGDVLSTDEFSKVNFEFFVNNNDQLNLSASQSFDYINIFDLSGKQVMSQELSSNDENVAIQSLANGLYLAKVQVGEQTTTFKFVK